MLSSWKEIAHFFGKGVRTVQRWEKTLDLPIHRPAGAPSNVVLARTSDLEEWMHRGPVARAVSEEESTPALPLETSAELSKLEDEVMVLAAWSGLTVDSTNLLAPGDRIGFLTDLLSKINSTLVSERTARAA